jgi:hypothetical protein
MSENLENVTLEHLRAIRSDMAKMANSMRLLGTEMTAIRQHMAGVVTIQEYDHSDLAAIKVRLERLERRIELSN